MRIAYRINKDATHIDIRSICRLYWIFSVHLTLEASKISVGPMVSCMREG